MFVAYIVIGVILLLVGFGFMCFFISEEVIDGDDGIVFFRVIALFTFGSWAVALTWPLLLVSVVPVLFIWGAVVAIRAAKNKTLDYSKKNPIQGPLR